MAHGCVAQEGESTYEAATRWIDGQTEAPLLFTGRVLDHLPLARVVAGGHWLRHLRSVERRLSVAREEEPVNTFRGFGLELAPSCFISRRGTPSLAASRNLISTMVRTG